MENNEKLENALRIMVSRYGMGRVQDTLRQIDGSVRARRKEKELSARDMVHRANGVAQLRLRNPARAYVSKLESPVEVHRALVELAQKFDDKAFLPTFGDVRNFCRFYGIDLPASPSRGSAIPRIFKRLSQLPPVDLRAILRTGAFSGPSQLAPIADAIRRRSRREEKVKRDPELLRSLLFEMEHSHTHITVVTMDRSADEYHHFQLLCDEGLVEQTGQATFRLTSSGHDFLDTIRDDSRWQKVMGHIKQNGGDWTLGILKELASQLLRDTLLR
ncbi:MAG: DUF2513 domain-containing protein [Deltaproteobacteria bacterium]|nr:DUF2513 domain-containing protein [Deltaproteobacteria bacterium]